MASKGGGPIYQAIQKKITQNLNPIHLEIHDDSHKHANHAAMKGLATVETHFRLVIVSDSFNGMPLIKRHRTINSLLQEELEKKGLHALQLVTKTVEEFEKS